MMVMAFPMLAAVAALGTVAPPVSLELPLRQPLGGGAVWCRNAEQCATTPLYQIPGPTPLLSPRPGAWDSVQLEMAGSVVDNTSGKHYLFYHASGDPGRVRPDYRNTTVGYQIGSAVSSKGPLGPFVRTSNQPALPAGRPGSWDENGTAGATVVRALDGRWLMFYEGSTNAVGLAVSESGPAGPWQRHRSSPIIVANASHVSNRSLPAPFNNPRNSGFYISTIIERRSPPEWWLYAEAPICHDDQGVLSRWVAPRPEGPWRFGGRVLLPQPAGFWDDGGFSESKVVERDGLFHLFFSSGRLLPERRRRSSVTAIRRPSTRLQLRSSLAEQLGYAVSVDGIHFKRHVLNPVGQLARAVPGTRAMAEAHLSLFGATCIYVYHTQKWQLPPPARAAEDLGVQIFVPATLRYAATATNPSPSVFVWHPYTKLLT
eukprot:SAG11_NODE_336_length_10544_cov_9.794926_1_plen_430_part_00